MAISFKYGKTQANDTAAHEKTYEVIHAFCDAFTKKNGSLICRELLGCGMTQAREKGLFGMLCKQYVRDSAQILDGILESYNA